MIIFQRRYDLLRLSKQYHLPKIYDLLNVIKPSSHGILACTDGKHIFVDEQQFNIRTPESQFFIICHELLHILYHHNDQDYYPVDKYKHRELLNICQDVVINEYLFKRLKYKETEGVYLDNLSKCLMNRGIIYSNIKYRGVLSTHDLYEYITNRMSDDDVSSIVNDLSHLSNDLVDEEEEEEQDKVRQQIEQTTIDETLENVLKGLRISQEILDREAIDKDENAGTSNAFDAKVNKAPTIISYKEMIKFIEQFIGTTAVMKARHRTYTRPSRRINLDNNMVAAGYKQRKTVNKISIYLDVSGSMDRDLIKTLFATLKSLYTRVPFNLFIFNYDITPIDIAKTNELPIGGGTRIQYVLDTIEKENQDAAILITDCEDKFSLKKVKSNLMFYTNELSFKSDNKNVQVTYFKN